MNKTPVKYAVYNLSRIDYITHGFDIKYPKDIYTGEVLTTDCIWFDCYMTESIDEAKQAREVLQSYYKNDIIKIACGKEEIIYDIIHDSYINLQKPDGYVAFHIPSFRYLQNEHEYLSMNWFGDVIDNHFRNPLLFVSEQEAKQNTKVKEELSSFWIYPVKKTKNVFGFDNFLD